MNELVDKQITFHCRDRFEQLFMSVWDILNCAKGREELATRNFTKQCLPRYLFSAISALKYLMIADCQENFSSPYERGTMMLK